MRIRRIEELEYQVFGGFTWSTDLLEFADLNVIYAPNGSGKSTFARVMRMATGDLEAGDARMRMLMDDGSTLILDGREDGNGETLLRGKVFDQGFRRQALDSLHGIRWSIGREEVDREKRLEELAKERQKLVEISAESQADAKKADIALEEFLELQNTEIRNLLNVLNPRANHGVSKVRTRLVELERQFESDGAASIPDELVPEMSRKLRRELDDDTAREPMKSLNWSDATKGLRTIDRNVAKLVKNATIGSPGDREEVAPDSWLVQGMGIHAQHAGEGCPFCHQEVPEARLRDLELVFDSAYDEFRAAASLEVERVASTREAVRSLSIPESVAFDPSCVDEVSSTSDSLAEQKVLVENWLNAIEALITRLLDGEVAVESADLPSVDFDLTAVVAGVNRLIADHNSAVTDQAVRRNAAEDALVEDVHIRALGRFRTLSGAQSTAVDAAAEHRTAASTKQEEIDEIRRQMSDTADSAPKISDEIARYLGHRHLTVESLDHSYRILRDGQPAADVSEGERTAITLTHFLQSLNDSDVDLSQTVVVIDDPVSSMDSSAIHSAFAFLTEAIFDREARKMRGQIFIMTHEFSFFKLLRDWCRHLPGAQKKDPKARMARFYELRVSEGERLNARVVAMNPMLLRYNSEYHYLFSRLVTFDPERDLLVMPTLARRFLEAFLAFRSPLNEGDLRRQLDDMLERFPELGPEQQTRLRSLCNTGSHASRIAVPSQDLGPVDEVPKLVDSTLGFVAIVDQDHYERMRAVVEEACPELSP